MRDSTKSYLCSSCSYYNGNGACILLRREIVKPEEQFCDLHQRNVAKCYNCGSLMPHSGVIIDDNLYCIDCYKQFNTCVTCKHECGLETDNSGIPKQVMGSFQMNGMTYQGPVANPALIEKYCRTCPCNNGDTCQRKTNVRCDNYL